MALDQIADGRPVGSERARAARRRASIRTEALDALRELPSRMPPPDSPPAREIAWTLVDIDRYEVRVGSQPIGYVDVVGAVFVALAGPVYARATEVRQTLRFDEAVRALQRAPREVG